MTVKSIIRNLLPHFIATRYGRRYGQPPAWRQYLEIGDSILQPNFSIEVFSNQESRKYVTAGKDNMLDCQILFESGTGQVVIGDRVYIGNSKIICRSKVEFGSNIFVAWGVYFYDHDSHSLDYRLRQEDITQQLEDHRNGNLFIKNKNWSVVNSAPIKVGDNAWIGMNALILKGVTIGEGAVVGAGSVVTKDVEPWTVVAGNPAKLVKKLDKQQAP
jgi:acetyltransferase-like isoleucine patch superfamily enzyme